MARVSASVEAELSKLPDGWSGSWQAELARTLAATLDSEPNASMARELRALMKDIMADGAIPSVEVDTGDELAAQRAARIARASGS